MASQQAAGHFGTTTRRGFLKTAAAGALALGPLTIARGAHAAGDEAIKIGMIGCGGRCTGAAAQSLSAGPYVKLVAMCDLFEDRVQAARNNLRREAKEQVQVDDDHCFVGFDGYRKVIDSADVVLIACASKFHPMYAEAAIKAGKHVFVEKPHAIDPVGCRRMQAVCELAKEKNLSIVSGLQSRYHAGYQETVKRIHEGAIGDVVSMQAMFLRGPYQTVSRNPKYTETQYQFSNWYHFLWLSGDDVPQSLVHNMDRVAWILKEEMPAWCFGLAGRSTSFGEVYGDMFDHHTVVYEYASGPRVYALCQTRNGTYGNSSDIVTGTKGVCYLGPCRIEGETKWQFEGPHNNPYEAEQKALIEAVRSGQPINSGYHMVNSTLSTVMGQIACYQGTAVKWEEVAKSDLQFGPSPDESSFETPPPSKPDATGNYPLPVPGLTRLI
ncbi:MAG: Gfo/Idh/MocA family oxidoreductase [Thermoguttaceae bacterium]|nr:Gfo/Idh/MocA family oxidoreductase [Thermoguttaceae bacterium]